MTNRNVDNNDDYSMMRMMMLYTNYRTLDFLFNIFYFIIL